MASKSNHFIVHPAAGGLDTMTSPTLLAPDWLQEAENIEYFNPGSKKKRLGTRLFGAGSPLGSGTVFQALLDFWSFNTVNTHQFMAVTSNGLMTDSALTGGFGTSAGGSPFSAPGAQAQLIMAEGYAVAFNSLGSQLPYISNGVVDWAPIATAGCAPGAAGGAYHLRRLFVHGDPRTFSTVYYTAAGDITNFEGADAGSLIFDENDGDKVVGISKPFRGAIYVFKGPNVGSIHAITGRTIRSLARDRIMDAAPCIAQNTIVTTPNDIYWMSTYGIHSLLATQKYGNTEEAYLSHRIKNVWERLQTNGLNGACSFYHPTRNIIGWFVPEAGYTQNTIGLIYNYVLGFWSIWRYSFNVASCMVAKSPSSGSSGERQRLYLGGYDGRVREADQTSLADDGSTAYTARITFAKVIKLGDAMNELSEKSFQSVTTFFNPVASASNAQMNVTVDGRLQTFNVSLQASGATFGSAIFGTSTFGAGSTGYFAETPFGDRGRTIQIGYVNSGVQQEMDILGYGIRAVPAETHALETS